MQSSDVFSTLKRFDAYPKTLEDFRVKTFGGAAGEQISYGAPTGFVIIFITLWQHFRNQIIRLQFAWPLYLEFREAQSYHFWDIIEYFVYKSMGYSAKLLISRSQRGNLLLIMYAQ